MAIDTNLNQLVINKLTKAQYQEAKEAGSIVETEIYMVTDENDAADHTHDAGDITSGMLPITNGGTGASNGSEAMKNLLASGDMILSSYQYGDTLPEAGIVGRIFFKKVNG